MGEVRLGKPGLAAARPIDDPGDHRWLVRSGGRGDEGARQSAVTVGAGDGQGAAAQLLYQGCFDAVDRGEPRPQSPVGGDDVDRMPNDGREQASVQRCRARREVMQLADRRRDRTECRRMADRRAAAHRRFDLAVMTAEHGRFDRRGQEEPQAFAAAVQRGRPAQRTDRIDVAAERLCSHGRGRDADDPGGSVVALRGTAAPRP